MKLKACGHLFHKQCLEQWALKQSRSQVTAQRHFLPVRPTCPMCRTPLDGYTLPLSVRNALRPIQRRWMQLIPILPTPMQLLWMQLIPILAVGLPVLASHWYVGWLKVHDPRQARVASQQLWALHRNANIITTHYMGIDLRTTMV